MIIYSFLDRLLATRISYCYRLSATGYRSRLLPATGYRLPDNGWLLPATGYRLLATGLGFYRLPAIGYRLPVNGRQLEQRK